MLMIGCDFHTRFQQIAMMDSQTGEILADWTTRQAKHGSFTARFRVRPASGWKPQGAHSGTARRRD